MKILVLSDSHQIMKYMVEAVELEHPDYVIHLGDCVGDAQDLQKHYPMLPIAFVRGNCDFFDLEEETKLTEYDGVRILITHGHKYGVKSGLLRYLLAAKENQVDIALFGHTHCAYCENESGIWMVNPGSCGAGARPTYAIIEIKNGVPMCSIHTFE